MTDRRPSLGNIALDDISTSFRRRSWVKRTLTLTVTVTLTLEVSPSRATGKAAREGGTNPNPSQV